MRFDLLVKPVIWPVLQRNVLHLDSQLTHPPEATSPKNLDSPRYVKPKQDFSVLAKIS